MSAVFSFIMDRMFTIDLLLVGLIFAFKFPHRKLFVLRLLLSLALCLIAGHYGSRYLHDILPDVLNNMGVGFIYEFALVLCVLAVCYKMSLSALVYVGSSAYFIQHSIYCIKSLFSDTFYKTWWDILFHFGFLMIIVAAVYALFYRKVDAENLKTIKLKHVMVCVGIILILCVILNATAGNDQQAKRSFLLADLLCNVVGVIFQYSILVISINNNENIRIKELLDKSAEQFKISKENIEQINIKCHDLRHQIESFYAQGKINKDVLAEMQYTVDIYDACVKTGNVALDTIITEKSLLCANMGINFSCIVDGVSLNFMKVTELYAVFSNALENAIEAVQQIEDKEKRVISLTARKAGNMYSIQIQNYTADKVVFNGGLPMTKKEDKINHGYGVKSIKMVIEKYGGKIAYKQDGEIFVLNMVIPIREKYKIEKKVA